VRFRFADFARSIGWGELPSCLHVLTMFLFGLAAWRRGIFRHPAEHRRLLRAVVLIGLPFGAITRSIALLPFVEHGPYWARPFVVGLALDGRMALALAYAAAIVLLLERPSARSVLAVLAPLGRMALTNYLLQSLVCTFLFYGYGFGLYDRLDSVAGAAIVVG